jgi:hypothetical protein
MTSPWSIRCWSSTDGHPARAYELVSVPVAPQAFRAALAFLGSAVPADSAFVVVRLGTGDETAIRQAIEVVNECQLSSRICVAVDRATLMAVDFSALDGDRVGLLLDDIDAETPLAGMAHDAIEAVRFHADFVGRASRNLRQGCVLEAMFGLARNLGLCTLGPRVANADAISLPGTGFDYVPDGPSDAPADPVAVPQIGQSRKKTTRATQFSR